LGYVLHALKEPCAYLPTLDQIQNAQAQSSDAGGNLESTNRFLTCETDRKTFSDKIILNVIDDTGSVVAQYIQHPQENAVATINILEFILKSF